MTCQQLLLSVLLLCLFLEYYLFVTFLKSDKLPTLIFLWPLESVRKIYEGNSQGQMFKGTNFSIDVCRSSVCQQPLVSGTRRPHRIRLL